MFLPVSGEHWDPTCLWSLEGPDGTLRVFPAPSFHTGDPRHLKVPHSHGLHQPRPSSYNGGTTSGLRPTQCPRSPPPSPTGRPQLTSGDSGQATSCSGPGFLIQKRGISGISPNLVIMICRVKTQTWFSGRNTKTIAKGIAPPHGASHIQL